MHHKNEVTKIIQEIVAGQGLEISFEIGRIHQLMDDYAESQNASDSKAIIFTAYGKSFTSGRDLWDWIVENCNVRLKRK